MHILLNDISLLYCHLLNKLCQDAPVYALPHVPISTQIIATVTKNSIHSSQNDRYQHIEILVATSFM